MFPEFLSGVAHSGIGLETKGKEIDNSLVLRRRCNAITSTRVWTLTFALHDRYICSPRLGAGRK